MKTFNEVNENWRKGNKVPPKPTEAKSFGKFLDALVKEGKLTDDEAWWLNRLSNEDSEKSRREYEKYRNYK